MADGKPAAPEQGIIRREFIRRTGAALATTTGAVALGAGPRRARAAGATELTFASAKFFGKETIAQVVDAYNQSQAKVHVTYVELPPPSSSTEVHQSLVQQLARRSGSPDVFTQDIVWIAEFAAAGWALSLDDVVDEATRKEYFPGIVEACTWQGRLTALPWFLNSGMLYYRTDLLGDSKPPETWQQLVETAQKLTKDGKARFGFLWQGKQAEVLVCDLVSFITSNNGSILGPDGKTVMVAEPAVADAVQFMHDTIGKYGISPQDVLSWDEEPSRRPFTAGQSVFLRNWSYVWPIAQDKTESGVVGQGRAWGRCRTFRAARAPPASAGISTASMPRPRTAMRRSTSFAGCPRPRPSFALQSSSAWRLPARQSSTSHRSARRSLSWER